MKYYDYKKAKQIITENQQNLKRASLGMHEDWFWTAETIWENGEFKHELPDNAMELENIHIKKRKAGMSVFLKEKDEMGLSKFNNEYFDTSKHRIAGILGSDWATPVIMLEFKNGEERFIDCHDNGEQHGLMPPMLHGVLSGPVQDNIKPIER